MKKYYFKAEKLRVGYGKQPLIENIEICLEKGEILTLIGQTGQENRPSLRVSQNSLHYWAVRSI